MVEVMDHINLTYLQIKECYTNTSGCPWPSATVKSPGFFKLGSRFSFF
jgi:hypothetical protein